MNALEATAVELADPLSVTLPLPVLCPLFSPWWRWSLQIICTLSRGKIARRKKSKRYCGDQDPPDPRTLFSNLRLFRLVVSRPRTRPAGNLQLKQGNKQRRQKAIWSPDSRVLTKSSLRKLDEKVAQRVESWWQLHVLSLWPFEWKTECVVASIVSCFGGKWGNIKFVFAALVPGRSWSKYSVALESHGAPGACWMFNLPLQIPKSFATLHTCVLVFFSAVAHNFVCPRRTTNTRKEIWGCISGRETVF